eukprot:scaffold1646_cov384-Prasinococcus_capsulatus_cf.AAC.12
MVLSLTLPALRPLRHRNIPPRRRFRSPRDRSRAQRVPRKGRAVGRPTYTPTGTCPGYPDALSAGEFHDAQRCLGVEGAVYDRAEGVDHLLVHLGVGAPLLAIHLQFGEVQPIARCSGRDEDVRCDLVHVEGDFLFARLLAHNFSAQELILIHSDAHPRHRPDSELLLRGGNFFSPGQTSSSG